MTLIAGDTFGERSLLGRSKIDSDFVACVDGTVIASLMPRNLDLIWQVDPRLEMSWMGNVALRFAAELRSQFSNTLARPRGSLKSADASIPNNNNNNSANSNVKERKKQASRATVAIGRATQSQLASMHSAAEETKKKAAVKQSLEESATLPVDEAAAAAASATSATGDCEDAVVMKRECRLGKRSGMLLVSPMTILFESTKNLFGLVKRVEIPFEAIERLSTNVPDDVIRGKRQAKKIYSKQDNRLHIIKLSVRKQKKSITVVERILGFYNESDCCETYLCLGKLVQTAAEDRLSSSLSKLPATATDVRASRNMGAGADTIVSKAVALFDFSLPDSGFHFKTGDVLLMTAQKKDLRVRGRRVDGTQLEWFPSDYVEPIVWVGNLRGIPTEAELDPLLAAGQERTFEPDAVVVRQGQELESIYIIKTGVCKVLLSSSRVALGKMGPGDVFGEISFLLGGNASATVQTVCSSTIVEVKKNVVRSLFSVRSDLASKFYRWFAALNLRRVERNVAAVADASSLSSVAEGEFAGSTKTMDRRLSMMKSVTTTATRANSGAKLDAVPHLGPVELQAAMEQNTLTFGEQSATLKALL